jgi:hypothetical protein
MSDHLPLRSQCKCICHADGSAKIHFSPCCRPDPDPVPPARMPDREALIERLRILQDHYPTSGQLGPGNERIFAECIAALAPIPDERRS